jgi:hypothetical protein
MKLTLVSAILTAALSEAGMSEIADLSYVVTALVAWSQCRRTLTRVMSQQRRGKIRSPI